MKKPINKAQIRAEMNQDIAKFIKGGGEVSQISQGISGYNSTQGTLKPDPTTFQGPKSDRTYVPEVVAALEARKHPPPKPKHRKPRKKMIYDDFGEPLRWEWEE